MRWSEVAAGQAAVPRARRGGCASVGAKPVAVRDISPAPAPTSVLDTEQPRARRRSRWDGKEENSAATRGTLLDWLSRP